MRACPGCVEQRPLICEGSRGSRLEGLSQTAVPASGRSDLTTVPNLMRHVSLEEEPTNNAESACRASLRLLGWPWVLLYWLSSQPMFLNLVLHRQPTPTASFNASIRAEGVRLSWRYSYGHVYRHICQVALKQNAVKPSIVDWTRLPGAILAMEFAPQA